ncbi:MAG: winged helix-turn-helix domain-containing protein, partial [Candidatus Lokiarchaeota archaeon]
MDIKKGNIFREKWDQLIKKHELRFEIWTILELHNELNVTQITHYVEQSKSTVARHLKLMEEDGLLMSKTAKDVVKGRIPPKIYSINPKFKEKLEGLEEISFPEDLQNLHQFYKSEILNYRKMSYNIKKLLDYLDPLLELLENNLDDIERAKNIYDKNLSYIDEPILLYFDKQRSKKFIDLRTEYILKLHKLAMEEDLNTEEAFVYFDISLPIAALFE